MNLISEKFEKIVSEYPIAKENVLFGCKMTVKTNNEIYKFEISNKSSGCPWQKENIAHLKEINCCYA